MGTDTGWSEYWDQEGSGGEVFVSGKGERHPALAAHWQRVFDGLPAGTRVLDVASGAGSIFATLPEDHGHRLTATDIAAEALDTLSERITGVETVTASADDLPFDDSSFDLVVSQFGIEYAGVEAFAEAARVVAAGGRLVVLAHIEDGYIDGNNKAQLAEAELVRSSKFIPKAIELTKAAFGTDARRLHALEQAFVPRIRTLGDAARRCPRGVHSYLLGGFRQLYENRQRYDCGDITGWLDGMQAEVDKAMDRLTRMRAAALSDGDIKTVCDLIAGAGLIDLEAMPFKTPNNDIPVAWDLSARRPD